MGFDFGALVAGVSEGAATAIDKRNKEIRQSALRDFETLQKTAGEQDEKLRTKRDELKATAEVLSGFTNSKGGSFTPSQIVGLLQKPAIAKEVVSSLKEKKDLDLVDFSTVFKLANDTPELKREAIDKYISESTSVSIPTAEAPQKVVRGAFGFESPAYAQAQNEFTTATGADLKELRAKAALRGEMPEYAGQKVEGTANLAQFKNPDAISNVQAQLRDRIANGESLDTTASKNLLAKLRANAVIEDMFNKEKGDDGKPRTAAQINSVFNTSLRVGLDPFIVKGVIRIDPQTNEPIVISGDAAAVKGYQEHKNKLIKEQAVALGILDKDNKIVGGRNSMDALLPYAVIEDGKVVSWKSGSTETTKKDEKPATPPTPEKPAAVSKEAIAIPKTKDGKIDGTKLVPGQLYTASNGSTSIWNGTGWQKPPAQ
jgi:hypothetical protein